MNNARVDADPESVRRLSAALAQYQADLAIAGKRVRGALNDARWHDRRKDQFEERYQELQKTIRHFTERETQEMIRELDRLAGQLEEILHRRM